jgi:DNA primase
MSLSHVHITPQLVSAVRDAVDIVAVASEHTKLRKAGRQWTGLCPIHKEKTPSFSVEPTKGLFYCFGCGAGGDAIRLHMLLSGDDFPAAIETLARRHGIPLPAPGARRPGAAPDERDLEPALRAAEEYFAGELRRSTFALGYLERRRIPPELQQRFGLGYAPDAWRGLLQALRPRVSIADLEAAGLVARPEGGGEPYDRFRHRLVFPIRTASGRLVGFGGRTLGDDRAKYLNTSETESFHKSRLLFGLDQAKRAVREAGKVLLVEGYFDVLGAVSSGVEWSVASMGTSLTPEQARLLSRYADEVIVGYDADEAGESAARRALVLLLAEGLGARRARFGGTHDPDSLRLAAGEQAVRDAVLGAGDAVELEIDRLIPAEVHRNPRLRAKAASAVAELLQPIRDGILRYGYGRVAADRLGVPPELLWRRLGVDRQSLAPPPAPAGREGAAPRVVRTEEEKVLRWLLDPGETTPASGQLPPPEAFLDPWCRNIYTVLHRLYGSGPGRPPDLRAVQRELAADGGDLDRVARLLLEDAASPGPEELGGSLHKLMRRWRRQRARELAREIAEAERTGDRGRLAVLLEEKAELTRALHRPETPEAS